jgi:hypothetical protein
MDKLMSVYFSEADHNKRCEIILDTKDERYTLKYYDGDKFIGEEYIPDHSLSYLEDAAENWALGIKVVDFDGGT